MHKPAHIFTDNTLHAVVKTDNYMLDLENIYESKEMICMYKKHSEVENYICDNVIHINLKIYKFARIYIFSP